MKSMAGLAALLLALSGPATGAIAQSFAQIHDAKTKPVSATGGALLANGKAGAGSGFSTAHLGKGEYLIKFKTGTFTGLPVFTCSPLSVKADVPICVVWLVAWSSNMPTTVEFHIYSRSTGDLEDNDFNFTEFTTTTTD